MKFVMEVEAVSIEIIRAALADVQHTICDVGDSGAVWVRGLGQVGTFEVSA